MFWLKDKRGKEKKTSWILCKKKIVQRILWCFFLWFWPDIWKLYAFLYFMPSDHSNLLLFITDTGVTCSYTSILTFDAYCTTYWEPSRTSKIRFLTKTARGFQSLTIFTKSSILDILQDTEHSSELSKKKKQITHTSPVSHISTGIKAVIKRRLRYVFWHMARWSWQILKLNSFVAMGFLLMACLFKSKVFLSIPLFVITTGYKQNHCNSSHLLYHEPKFYSKLYTLRSFSFELFCFLSTGFKKLNSVE